MKPVVIGIFAHPDDETFGPSGTLAKWAAHGVDIHTITLTCGENGANPDKVANLAARRRQELTAASKILGFTSSTCLRFPDSGLSHGMYPSISKQVEAAVTKILRSYDEKVEVSLMSFEDHGISGHLDHIAASFLATRLFCTLQTHQRLKDIWYYCLSETQAPESNWTTFFTPRGRSRRYINCSIDVTNTLALKFAAMDKHVSQRHDSENIKKLGRELLSTEYFHVSKATADQES